MGIVVGLVWRYLGAEMGLQSEPGDRAETRIQLCGRLVVRVAGERVEDRIPGRQGRLLLAYLAVSPYRTATRDELTEAIWPASLPAAPDTALSALLSKLRRLLGPAAVEGRREIRLSLPPDAWIDAECARRQLHKAESLISAERWWDAYAPAVTARYISERPFLRGDDVPWVEGQRREMAELNLRAIECDARIGLAVRGPEANLAIQSARRLIELAPYRESGYCLLMTGLHEVGNHAEALQVYEQLRRLLRDELGAAPSPATQEVHRRLLAPR